MQLCHLPLDPSPHHHPVSFPQLLASRSQTPPSSPSHVLPSMRCGTLLLCPQLNRPRVGIYPSWPTQSLPLEDIKKETWQCSSEWLSDSGASGRHVFHHSRRHWGSWFVMRAENEIDTKRGTGKKLEKPCGTWFLVKACVQSPVITFWGPMR